jgi:hypothetical protein
VPSKQEHLRVAHEDEQLLHQLNIDHPCARGWASTVSFYAALHYVEAFFSTQNKHSADHRTRDSNLSLYPETLAIYDEYSELKNISTGARYYGRYPDKNSLAVEVRPALARVKSEMSKHL